LLVLAPQAAQFFPFHTGQPAMAFARINLGLLDPIADRLSRWLEFAGEFINKCARLLPRPGFVGEIPVGRIFVFSA
jgi:hypothetical protein